jgi:hypothetical protein
VDHFDLINPSVNLIQEADGSIQIQPNLLKPQPAAPASAGASKKPSELIHIKHFKISDLTVHVIDAKDPSAVTTAWVHLTVEGAAGAGPGDYDVHVEMNEKPLAQMALDTSINIDGDSVKFKNFSLNVTAPAEDALAQLPPPVASFIRDHGLAGAGVTMSMADGASVAFDTSKNHWSVSGLSGRLQLSSPAGKPLADGAVVFNVAGGGSIPSAGAGSPLDYLATLDPGTTLSVHTDSAVSLQSGLPQSLTGGAFDFEYANNAFTLKTFDANYGAQKLHLDLAAGIASNKLTLNGFHLNVAGGTVLVSAAELNLVAPYNYSAHPTFQDIQLSDVKDIIQLTSQPHLCGLAAGKLDVSGTLPPGVNPLTTVQGDGEAHVQKADFWDVRFLGGVATKVFPNFVSATQVGDADFVYTLGNSQMHLSKMEVGCPILGVSGTGDVGLVGDNQLNLLVSAQPLGDWQKQVGGIPGLNVLGQAAGAAQGTLNKATAGALGLRVTGPAANPSIVPAAADAIGGAAKGAAGAVGQGAGDVGKGLMNLFQPKKNGP